MVDGRRSVYRWIQVLGRKITGFAIPIAKRRLNYRIEVDNDDDDV